MPSRLSRRSLVAALLGIAAPASAQTNAARRFPQPVVVGTLLGRQVLRPVEQQDVLGRVAGLVRTSGGAPMLVIRTGGVLGLGTRDVAVPLSAAALLGEHVALLDVTPEQLRALPGFDAAGTTPVPPDQTVSMGLARPFH